MARWMASLGQVWFPLALIGLLLLGIPGAVLLAFSLLGLQGWVNQWLQTHWFLSYHLPIPWWAAGLLLLAPLAVVLLYFLKLKRKPLHVPSTFLWRQSIEDLHVNSLFQWLRENILLLLQLLALLALIYAVMALQFHGTNTHGAHYILLLDNSASMSATDVAPNRLEQAKREALKVIDSHSDQDFGMLLVFNSQAETRQSYTSDRERLREAVRQVQPTQRPTRIDDALSYAASLANPTRSTENEAARPAGEEPGKERTYVAAEGIPTAVHLFSDGRFPDVAEFSQGNLDLRFHLIGEPARDKVDNVGIVTLNASRDESDPSKLQVLVNVRNYRAEPAAVKVRLQVLINGEHQGIVFERLAQPQGEAVADPAKARVAGRTVRELPPEKSGEGPRLLDRPGEGLAIFELGDVDDRATITLDVSLPDIRDRFALDDRAWMVVGVVRKARVLLVGTPNRVLEAFFDHSATRKVAQVSYLLPEDLGSDAKYRRPALAGVYDLVVFDRCAPLREEDMPLANTWFIDALPPLGQPAWKKADLPKLKNPHIKGWMTQHPLMRYLAALYDVGIEEAFVVDLKDPRVPPKTPRLLETDKDAAVMFALPRQSFIDVVQTFPLLNDTGEWLTNWPLQPSFPLFLRNLLYTLGNVSDAAGEENVQPGQTKTIRPDVAVDQITVLNPAGEPDTLERGTRAEFAFSKTDQVGVYQARWGEGLSRSFAVNLLDADESNLEPRPAKEIQIGANALTASDARGQPREVWKWVALAALVFLLVEWYVYNRRIFV